MYASTRGSLDCSRMTPPWLRVQHYTQGCGRMQQPRFLRMSRFQPSPRGCPGWRRAVEDKFTGDLKLHERAGEECLLQALLYLKGFEIVNQVGDAHLNDRVVIAADL